MPTLQLLSLILLTADPASEEGWTRTAAQDGVEVFTRRRDGTGVTEIKGYGLIDAPPHEVWKAIRDYDNYPRTMPYIEAARILATEDEGRVLYVYNRISAPLIDRRDYAVKVQDKSDWRDGAGYLKMAWTIDKERAPKPLRGVVRVQVNDGFWLLEPRDEGKRTFAVYYLFTDPGGAVPKFIVNRANTSAIPDIFRAVRKVTQAR